MAISDKCTFNRIEPTLKNYFSLRLIVSISFWEFWASSGPKSLELCSLAQFRKAFESLNFENFGSFFLKISTIALSEANSSAVIWIAYSAEKIEAKVSRIISSISEFLISRDKNSLVLRIFLAPNACTTVSCYAVLSPAESESKSATVFRSLLLSMDA